MKLLQQEGLLPTNLKIEANYAFFRAGEIGFDFQKKIRVDVETKSRAEIESEQPKSGTVLIRSENPLIFISSLIFSVENHFLPILISSRATSFEVEALIERFNPAATIFDGVFNSTELKLSYPADLSKSKKFSGLKENQEIMDPSNLKGNSRTANFSNLDDGTEFSGNPSVKNFHQELQSAHRIIKSKYEVTGEDAVVILTSGSSGKPKAVVHSFSSLLSAAEDGNSALSVVPTDRWLLSLPLNHISGFMIMLRAAVAGVPLIVESTDRNKSGLIQDGISVTDVSLVVKSTDVKKRKTAESKKQKIEDNKAHKIGESNEQKIGAFLEGFAPTIVSWVPAQLKNELSNQKYRGKFRKILLGGATAETQLLKHAVAAGYPIVLVYGSSETAAFISMCDLSNFLTEDENISDSPDFGDLQPDLQIEDRVKSANSSEYSEQFKPKYRAIQGVNLSVKDGVLLLKSNHLFSRYLDDEKLSATVLKDGFFNTGDLAELIPNPQQSDRNAKQKAQSEPQYFILKGRGDRVLISGGINVDPQEIERAIKSYPGVDEAFVFGIQDSKWGDAISALVTGNLTIDLADLYGYLREKIAAYKVPKYLTVVDSIPLTESGKPDAVAAQKLLF
ncbi:MAG: AMP-binding protein [Ignavibacteria bacterium]|nr:AMP-binding protein [Ignavibacteria bacterium]